MTVEYFHSEAEKLLRRAVEIFEKRLGRDHPDSAFAIAELAGTLTSLDPEKKREAERLLNEALATYERLLGPTHYDVAETLLRLAILNHLADKPAAALQLLDRIDRIHAEQPISAHLAQRLHAVRAGVLWRQGDRKQAISLAEKSLEQADLLRAYASGAERERAESFDRVGVGYEELIGWLAELNDVDQMFSVMERYKARSFLDELRLKGVDLPAGLPADRRKQLAEREAELRLVLLKVESQSNALPELEEDSPPADVATYKKLRQEVLRARDDLYRHLAEVRAASPLYRELLTAKTEYATLAQVQAHLADDELLISYFIGSSQSYALFVGSKSATIARLEVDAATAKTLRVASSPS